VKNGNQRQTGSENTAAAAEAVLRLPEKNQRREAMRVPTSQNQRPRPTDGSVAESRLKIYYQNLITI